MTKYQYQHRPWMVVAVQWTGNNFDEVDDFIAKHIDWDSDDGARLNLDDEDPGDRVIQFYAWGDDQEVDESRWIVVRTPGPDGEGWIMFDRDFRDTYMTH